MLQTAQTAMIIWEYVIIRKLSLGNGDRDMARQAGNTSAKKSAAKKANSGQGSTAKTAAKKGTTASRNGAGKQTTERKKSSGAAQERRMAQSERLSPSMRDEITLAVTLLVSILFFLSYINLCGTVGKWLNQLVFGLFGIFAYLFPFVLFFAVAFMLANRGNRMVRRKAWAVGGFFICIAALYELANGYDAELSFTDYYKLSAASHDGGGFIGGLPVSLLCPLFDSVATAVILVIFLLIFVMLLTGKELFAYIQRTTSERMKERRALYEEYEQQRLLQEQEAYDKGEEPLRRARIITFPKQNGEKQTEPVPVAEPQKPDTFLDSLKKRGRQEQEPVQNIQETAVEPTQSMPEALDEAPRERHFYNTIVDMKEVVKNPVKEEGSEIISVTAKQEAEQHEMREIPISGLYEKEPVPTYEAELRKKFGQASSKTDTTEVEGIKTDAEMLESEAAEATHEAAEVVLEEEEHEETVEAIPQETLSERTGIHVYADEPEEPVAAEETGYAEISAEEYQAPEREKTEAVTQRQEGVAAPTGEAVAPEDIAVQAEQTVVEKKYEFPPIELLAPPPPGKVSNEKALKETAMKLQSTLESFGVRVTVTNISCGPSVTQYELQPEQGVKVSQITKLSDDIKLNLAAADIRIEAPIPGKAAVGIEIPNKENTTVALRELLESSEFTEHKSKLAFAVGKNISGQTIVSDIAKMPHMLIAGATGSGKSVCINTIIMSILYKADPKDVKLIMVDPKVVELSIYNGIPHLMIPVVTDPKKASAALNWAVAEMTDRYNKFAQLGVRDLKGYNERVDKAKAEGLEDAKYPRLPQIVIIVDELADLMMVASNEVEDAICRLAQMARAAGLHLIIATQRPSVNVITGLIKANVPSRIAFAVTSIVDSRTILDGGGAEKLLGKGDMLFFPSGYTKPVRVQGAFVSDAEVSAVVDFLKEQSEGVSYSDEINQQITKAVNSEGGFGASGDNDLDDYFAEAGRFIIEKERASCGILQQVYKIGYNRAARIMEQLAAAGVVGPQEGTKPRKVLMTLEEFEQYLEEQ